MAVALNLEVKHRVNHGLIDDAEATVLTSLLVVGAINAVILEVELEAKHVLGVFAAADVSHLVSQGPFLVLRQRNNLFIRLLGELVALAARLGQLAADL